MRRITVTLLALVLFTAACATDSTVDATAITAAAASSTTETVATTAASSTTSTAPPPPSTTAAPDTTTTSSTTTTTAAPHPGVVGELGLGLRPCALEVGADGSAWVTMIGTQELVEIDPGTGEALNRVSTGPGPCGVAIAGGAIWIGDTVSNSVFWLAEDTLAFQNRIDLGGPPWDVQTLGDLVWATVRNPGRVVAIDPAVGEIVIDVAIASSQVSGVALTDGAAWVAVEGNDAVFRVDAASADVTEIEVVGRPSWLGASDGAVWVSQPGVDMVSKIDTASGEIVATVDVGREPLDITVAFGSVWVPNRGDGTVTRIDEASGDILDTYPLTSGIYVAEAVGAEIWVLDFSNTAIFRIDPEIVR